MLARQADPFGYRTAGRCLLKGKQTPRPGTAGVAPRCARPTRAHREKLDIDGEEEYEVDHIRDSKMFGHTLKYLIRWKGYSEGEDTWEPLSNLANSLQVIDEFHARNPGAPRSINPLLYTSLPWQSLYEHTANADVVP